MAKNILITEKPSVAMEFAKALKITTNRRNGYLESEKWIITWCVGHLVTMSYPEKYDEKLKFWRLDTLPFIPKEWKYEIIPNVQNQFNIVQGLMQREDIEEIYQTFESVSLKDKTTEPTAGGSVTSFRFNLSDGTSYEVIYSEVAVKSGRVITTGMEQDFFTSAGIGAFWGSYDYEVTTASEDELPALYE